MKFLAIAVLFVSSALTSTVAYADNDDLKWVAKCVQDNADAKVDSDIVAKYCACMNDKMDSNETQSIDKWEKTHKDEKKACEKKSGWQ